MSPFGINTSAGWAFGVDMVPLSLDMTDLGGFGEEGYGFDKHSQPISEHNRYEDLGDASVLDISPDSGLLPAPPLGGKLLRHGGESTDLSPTAIVLLPGPGLFDPIPHP